MSKRVIMRIEIAPRSKERLDEFCDGTGMTKLAAVSRLIDWFCEQEGTVQAMVQKLYPSVIEVDVAEVILENLKSRKGAGKRNGGADGHPMQGRWGQRARRTAKNGQNAVKS